MSDPVLACCEGRRPRIAQPDERHRRLNRALLGSRIAMLLFVLVLALGAMVSLLAMLGLAFTDSLSRPMAIGYFCICVMLLAHWPVLRASVRWRYERALLKRLAGSGR